MPVILKRVKAGDRQAFALVVQRFQQPLFGYLGRMGLRQSLAEEIAQETFLRAWTNLKTYDPKRAQFSTWLFTIARHLTWHELERAANQYEITIDEALEDIHDQHTQLVDSVSHAQLRQKLTTALCALPVPDRSALALAYFQELDLKAIADIENCSVSAIKVRLHRAKQRLRQLLEEPHE